MRAVAHQQFGRLDVAGAGNHHQRGLTLGVRRVGVGPGLQQRADDFRIGRHRRFLHRVRAVVVHGGDIGTRLDEALHEIAVIVVHGPVQGRRPIDALLANIGMLVDQCNGRIVTAGLRGIDERTGALGPGSPRNEGRRQGQ